MKPVRKIEYENLNIDSSYGSLAIDIWSQAEREEVVIPQKATKKKKFKWGFFKRAEKPLVKEETKVHPRGGANYRAKLLKVASAASCAIIMAAYFGCVLFGNMVVKTQEQLLNMQRVEMHLINEINEMQVAVEQLKGPERIREIASAKLNMVVARDNVFVNASKTKTIKQMYRAQLKDDVFLALGK